MSSSSEPEVPIVIREPVNAPSSTFYTYNFNVNKLNLVGKDIIDEGYYGHTIASAPNFLHTAYIDFAQHLYILSNDTSKKSLLYKGNKNLKLSLNTWSPDSKKLIFSTLPFRGYDFEGDPIYQPNFYNVVNITDGSLTTFPAGKGVTVEQFIDNSRILIDIFVPGHPNFHFITTVLNLDTMQLDQGWFEEKLGSMENLIKKHAPLANVVGRIFSLENSKYVYTIREQAREAYTNLPPELLIEGRTIFIYGDLQNKTRAIIADGKWEQYQNPLVSPVGDKVSYYEEKSGKNFDTPIIFWIYNAATGEHRSYVCADRASWKQEWLDNNKLLISFFRPAKTPSSAVTAYYILDTATNSIQKVWGDSTSPYSANLCKLRNKIPND